MKINADIMVVSPHPDDAEFGAAGSAARWSREGKVVVYVVCTNGDKGSEDPNVDPAELAKTREREQLKAARILGVNEVVFLRYPDQCLEDTSEFRKDIVKQIRIFRPETVVSIDPYPTRRYLWHRDHRIAGRVVLDAIFPYARDYLSYPDLLEEGLQPHKVKEILLYGAEDPNYQLEITDTFQLKLDALRSHESQVGKYSRVELEKYLMNKALYSREKETDKLMEFFYRIEVTY